MFVELSRDQVNKIITHHDDRINYNMNIHIDSDVENLILHIINAIFYSVCCWIVVSLISNDVSL